MIYFRKTKNQISPKILRFERPKHDFSEDREILKMWLNLKSWLATSNPLSTRFPQVTHILPPVVSVLFRWCTFTVSFRILAICILFQRLFSDPVRETLARWENSVCQISSIKYLFSDYTNKGKAIEFSKDNHAGSIDKKNTEIKYEKILMRIKETRKRVSRKWRNRIWKKKDKW